jgi:hypothetical protein
MLPGRATAAHLAPNACCGSRKIFAYDPVASANLALQGGVSEP